MALVLHTEGLTKTYRGVKVVDHVTVSIEKGEICGLIGGMDPEKVRFLK